MFGRDVALKKRELEAAANHFTREERAAMRRKLEEMDDAEDAAEAAAAAVVEEIMEELSGAAGNETEGEHGVA